MRIVAVAAIVGAAVAPTYRAPSAASAASQPHAAQLDAASRQALGEYAVAGGAIGNYYRARGGQRTFGPAISNPFTLMGTQVQIFRSHALKENLDGSVSTLPLLDMGAVPGVRIGGRTLPQPDSALIDSSPPPGTPDYAAQAQAFIRANAPDDWQGAPVGFLRAFLGTVSFEDAFPGGTGDRGLLPGMAQEVWGLPVSRPARDPSLPDVVYLRWERGVMAFDARTGQVETVPLGETFRAVLTGEGIPSDLIADAQASPYYAQFQPSAVNAVARPNALPDSSLAGAFQASGSAGFTSAAASQPYPTPTYDPYATPTSTPWGGGFTAGTPTATPWGGTGSPDGSISGAGITSSGNVTTNPAASPGVDVCHGDEQITYAPGDPRVGNELLIAVSSSRPHPYGRLAGTELTQFQRERHGQLGLVWEWIVRPTYPGKHKYTFYVDSTIPCKDIEIDVLKALATSTPKPPTPYGQGNGNSNDNSSSGSTADVSVLLSSGPTTASKGQTITYIATISNSGPENADKTTLTIAPSDREVTVTDITANSGGTCQATPAQHISCNVGRIDQGRSVSIPFTVTVGQRAASSFIVNVSAYSEGSDNLLSNNSASTTSVSVSSASSETTSEGTVVIAGSKCSKYSAQAAAQAALRADPHDPERLDTSSPQSATTPDGIACNSSYEAPEWAAAFYYPKPHDLAPVPTPIGGRRAVTSASALRAGRRRRRSAHLQR